MAVAVSLPDQQGCIAVGQRLGGGPIPGTDTWIPDFRESGVRCYKKAFKKVMFGQRPSRGRNRKEKGPAEGRSMTGRWEEVRSGKGGCSEELGRRRQEFCGVLRRPQISPCRGDGEALSSRLQPVLG